MTEEEQMKLAVEASVNQGMVPHGMTEEEQWLFQKNASLETVSDAEIRALEMDKEMDDMQVAMAISVMDLPMHEYHMGNKAYEISCLEHLISPHGVIMASEVLDIMLGMGLLNYRCSKCQMRKVDICVHFLPQDFAGLMKMRRVCKQWMVCIDNWIRRRRIMKSISNCNRCQLIHYKVPMSKLPHCMRARWCNLRIKLSNDYEVEGEEFPCHHPLHINSRDMTKVL